MWYLLSLPKRLKKYHHTPWWEKLMLYLVVTAVYLMICISVAVTTPPTN